MRSAVEWVESLTPWPEEFGLERMRALLDRLSAPQLAYPSIHVVGTNGKTTTVRMTETLLAGEGLAVGAYTSPHVTGWGERIRIRGEEADFERALERVRPLAEELAATQFEALTAAALAAFAQAEVDVAVVEAGLGGRLDATNVLRSPVQVLTNVALEHTEYLGATRESIAGEKLAVVQPGATVILAEPEWEALARANGAARVVLVSRSNVALAAAAAEEFLARPVATRAVEKLQVPGRLELVGERPLEVWDGAHTLDAVGYVLARLPRRRWTLVLSILADKDVDRLLAAFSALGDHVVTTQSANSRALPARELARRAERFFPRVEAVDDPVQALSRAREAAGEEGAVLVSGSLYLLASLAAVRTASVPWESSESD